MKKAPDRIIIILLNYHGVEDTLECLHSLEKVNYPNFQTIVVDNGSKDDSVQKIREHFPHLPILENGENLGFAGGNNPGIEWALRHHADWILLLNNDTIVDPQFLDEFRKASQEKPNAKVLGAKILSYNEPNLIDHIGGFWNPDSAEFICPDSQKLDHLYFEMKQVDYVCGAALLMHKTVPETIGLLEPNFFLFWEESDFCHRAKIKGFEIWTAPKAKVWHKISSSFTGGKPHMHYFWWRSRLLWIERNCSRLERKKIYRKVIFPELWKMARHYLLKQILYVFSPTPSRKQKVKRLKAGCLGAFHFYRKKFGNCPSSLRKK